MLPLTGAIVLAVLVGAAVGRGLGVPAVALAVGGVVVLVGGIRLPSILGLAFAVAVAPASMFPKVSPNYLIIAGEVAVAIGVTLLGGRRSLGVARLWWALAFIVLYWFAAERSIAAGGATLSPRFGFLAASAQVLLVGSGGWRESHADEVVEFSRIACLIGALVGLWAVAEFALDRGFEYPLVSGVRRAVGPFGNPNYLGGLLAQVAVLSLALTRVLRERRRSILPGLVPFALTGIGLLATLSRAALIGAGIGCLMVWTWTMSRRRRLALWIAVGMASVVAFPILGRAVDSERIQVTPGTPIQVQEQLAESVRARYLAIRLGVDYAVAHPLTGVGLERFPTLAEQDARLGIHMNTHDEPIRVAAEAGIPALVALFAVLWLAVKAVRRQSTDVRLLVLPVALTYLVCSLFVNGLEFVSFSYPCALLLFLGSGTPDDPAAAR